MVTRPRRREAATVGRVDRGPVGGGRRRRTAVVVLVLGLVTAAAIGLPWWFAGGVAGTATALPPAPAIGSCLDVGEGVAVPSPCDRHHAAEVIGAFTPGAGPGSAARFDSTDAELDRIADEVQLACWEFMPGYFGTGADNAFGFWAPDSVRMTVDLLWAPADQRSGGLGWSVCAVKPPERVTYLGTLEQGSGLRRWSWPPEFASCTSDRDTFTYTGCQSPHTVEHLGAFLPPTGQTVPPPSTALPADWTSECVRLISELIGVDDPTFGGRVRVAVEPLFHEAGPLPDCFIEVVGDHELTGTLVGLGDRPLPWS